MKYILGILLLIFIGCGISTEQHMNNNGYIHVVTPKQNDAVWKDSTGNLWLATSGDISRMVQLSAGDCTKRPECTSQEQVTNLLDIKKELEAIKQSNTSSTSYDDY